MELSEIRQAAARIKGGIVYTPCSQSIALSELTGCQIYCKHEFLQRTGSFKERGALNALLELPREKAAQGVVAASAGNHALGLAYHGRRLGIPVTVVMPEQAPLTKIRNCESFGARVILFGKDIGVAREEALRYVQSEGMTYIHGFNDRAVIAGQGSIALEILEQVPDCDAVIVPIGGAGLIAGIGVVLKALKPSIRVVGVEPENVPSFAAALRSGSPVEVSSRLTIADGLNVPTIGPDAFQIARQVVDEHLLVSERYLALAVMRLMELERSVVEGAGAAGLAALLQHRPGHLKGKKIVLPLCGGNIDLAMLGRVIERGLASDGRLHQLTLVISDRPGGLARLAALIAAERGNIVEINHDRAFAPDDLSKVTVHCLIETKDQDHIERLERALRWEGFLQ